MRELVTGKRNKRRLNRGRGEMKIMRKKKKERENKSIS